MKKLCAISLFSSGGIGDLALISNNIDILIANELLEERAEVFEFNFPDTKMLCGDIWKLKEEIISETKIKLSGKELDILYATPPCQGMSKNGRGKLLNGIRKGLKPESDERNRLIIPTLSIAKELKPRLIIFENVPEMENTIIASPDKQYISIMEYIKNELDTDYYGKAEVVEFADYGVPQRRQRLITVYTRDQLLKKYFLSTHTFLPAKTHSQNADNSTKNWITLRDTISNFLPLDAKGKKTATSIIQYHNVPILDEDKYFWVSNTPPERSAFDNQCIKCGYNKNPAHGSSLDKDGINRPNTDTPLYCKNCGSLLPRPWVKENGTYRLMKGFTSAYKRMLWDLPANALTTNLSYACSDSKLHPEQNRVLSLYEAFHIHTLNNFNYQWKRMDGKKVSDKTIREIIGESIPPTGLKIIMAHLYQLLNHQEDELSKYSNFKGQLSFCEH